MGEKSSAACCLRDVGHVEAGIEVKLGVADFRGANSGCHQIDFAEFVSVDPLLNIFLALFVDVLFLIDSLFKIIYGVLLCFDALNASLSFYLFV